MINCETTENQPTPAAAAGARTAVSRPPAPTFRGMLRSAVLLAVAATSSAAPITLSNELLHATIDGTGGELRATALFQQRQPANPLFRQNHLASRPWMVTIDAPPVAIDMTML